MPKKTAEEFEYLSNNPDFVPDPEIEEFMEEEISRAPKDPELLAHRLRNNTAASPSDAGGDLDATWEEVNQSGSETVAGDNPTPDQSLVEENAKALGVSLSGVASDEIILISRQSNSGTYDYFRRAILGPVDDLRLGTRDLNGSKEVVTLIASTLGAIG